MKKIVLVINAETNVVEQNLLLTDDNMPRAEVRRDANSVTVEIPTEDQASPAALDALRAKLTQPLSPDARHIMDGYEGPRTSQVTSEIPSSELCYDDWSGRFFMGSANQLERAMTSVNSQLMEGEFVNLNTFYDFLDLQPIAMGVDHGWNEEGVELRLGAVLSPTGRPALSFWFNRNPRASEYYR